MKWCALLLLAGGCDFVFRLDHVDVPDASMHVMLDAPPEACPASYAPVANAEERSVYRYVPLHLTWDAAELDCENDSETKITHLVVFEDLAEIAALRAIVTEPTYWQVLTGYARNTTAQGGAAFQFTSVLGDPLPVDATIWETQQGVEPDNGGTSGTEETITFFETNRNLTDGIADAPLSYLCECDGKRANQAFKIR